MTTYIQLEGTRRTGKSALVLHLIDAIHRQLPNARILVVDADPRQQVTGFLGGTSACTLAQICTRYAHVFRCGSRRLTASHTAVVARLIAREALMTHSRCDLLTVGVWDGAGNAEPAQEVLECGLAALSSLYDLVIVDHAAGGASTACGAMLPLDVLLLVTTPDPLSVQSALHIVDHRIGRASLGKRCWLVLNQMLSDTGIDGVIQMLLPPDDRVELAAILPESPRLRQMGGTQQSPLLLAPSDLWVRRVMDLSTRMVPWITTLRAQQHVDND